MNETKNITFIVLCVMGIFAILSSTMSKNPVLKPFATSLETPEGFWMGFVASASTIPGVLVSLPAASLSDILGRRKFLVISALIFASAPFLYLLISMWWQLILVRFYHGFATAIFVPVTEASIAELFPSNRGERISIFSSATCIGRGLAPFLGGYILFISDYSFFTLYLAVGIAGVTAFMTTLFFWPREKALMPDLVIERKPTEKLFSGWRKLAGKPGVLGVSFVQASQFFVFGAVEFFLVGYLKEVVQLDAFQIGTILGSQIVAVILTKPIMGRWSDKIGRRVPIIAGTIMSGLPLLFIPFSTQFVVLMFLSVAYGLGFSAVTSSTPALASELSPKDLIGTAMGFLGMTMDVGQTIGPLVTGVIVATNLGYTASFPVLTGVLMISVLVFAFFIR
ncbi:MAG: MFS transporter [Candidatus Bathyarchaeota archaeon]|nr:MAG: MFS transporter [Candidatus Bathyarchaeota archaeon]